MSAPTNHHLTITLPGGKTARGKVVYLQPTERWREEQRVQILARPNILYTGDELCYTASHKFT
jgi:hypothetical protein